jgi:hypothetical protein
MKMRQDRKEGFRQWRGKIAAAVLLMQEDGNQGTHEAGEDDSMKIRETHGSWPIGKKALMVTLLMAVLSLFGIFGHDAEAQDMVFANKGFLVDPGGAPSQGNTPYFAGLRWMTPGEWIFQVWDWQGNVKFSQQEVAGIGKTDFVTGSAVYFNGNVYAFAPFFEGNQHSCVEVFVLDPATWQKIDDFDLFLHWVDKPQNLKDGMGAVVANGQIYLFMTGSSTGAPVVYSSSDGRNFAMISAASAPNYPVVHDAITFIDPKDGKTKIMVVVSPLASNYYPLIPAVSIYDPTTDTWGPVSPLPQGALPNGTYGMHASAWFGSWRTVQHSNWSCGTYTWNSGNTDAYLHVLGAVWTGSMDYLVHWYLDLSSGTWVFDPSGCAQDLQAVWWVAPCPDPVGYNNRTPVALGPGYGKSTAGGCTSGDDCLQQEMWGLSCGFDVQGMGVQFWLSLSDLWVPTTVWQGTAPQGPWAYKTVDTSNPGDPAFGNDPNVYQSMAGMVRINGLVMGPPPFPADPSWQSPADWAQTSNVQLGQSSGTSSGTSSTFNSSVTAGVTGTVSAPFVQGKEGLSFTYGYSSTHSTENSFTSAYTWTLGTVGQLKSTLGTQGWMVGHAPIIWPASYVATSVRDPGPTGTYMGYSQMILSVGEAESLFWPYSLTNPSDTSYPMGFLLTGVKAMLPSTNVVGWNINQGGSMQDWSDTSSGNWSVVGGPAGSGTFPIGTLNTGSLQTQQFVKSETKSKDWSDSYSGTSSTSLRLGTKGENVTTTLDLSFGYETDGSSSTTFQQNMETSYLVPSSQGGYSEVYVQPYLLQAMTYNAPWVPKGYKGPLPWAITWDVTYAAKLPTMLGAPETVYAKSPPPKAAAGRITGYGPPNDPPDKPASEARLDLVVDQVRDDSYSITKGRLSYIGPGDTVTPVAMTADEFDPARGVTVTLNGYKLYANTRKGAWTRSWNTWKYASASGLEKLKLTLNFGAKTWDMSVSRIELGDRFAGLTNLASVTLDLNGRYLLSTRISHRMAYEWRADLTSLDQPVWVKALNVTKDLAGNGRVKLNGRLTDAVKSVGDTSVVLNGEAKHYPLMSKVKNFWKKVEEKGTLIYRDDNSSLRANLKSGVWSCEVDTDVFKHPLPFYHGDAELELKVGGKAYFKASIHPDSYVMTLQYESKP